MLKKLLSVLIVVCIFASMNVVYAADTMSIELGENIDLDALESEVPYEVRHAMEIQVEALNCYQQIIDSFEKDSLGFPIYPSEYAGAYIDNGNLIIQLVDTGSEMQNKYMELCGNNNVVRFKEVKYSMNELQSCESYALDMLQNGYDVTNYGINEKENIFEIALNSEIYDSNMFSTTNLFTTDDIPKLPIKFSYEKPTVPCISISGGCGIQPEASRDMSTAGVCGYYNGKNALLTCGHSYEYLDYYKRYPYVLFSGTQIGQISYQRSNTNHYETGIESYGDFSIITLNGNVGISNTLINGINITGTYSSLPVGTYIYKYGSKTGLSYGHITYAAMTSPYVDDAGTHFIRGLYRSDIAKSDGSTPITSGDSGGPVYIKSGSEYLLHGIVTAKGGNGNTGVMYSTPIYYAIDVGFTVKTR